MIHFDRSGVEVTDYFEYQGSLEKVMFFVKVLLAIFGVSDVLTGLDTSFSWTLNPAGRRIKGTVDFRPDGGRRETFDIVGTSPFMQRLSLRSMGTICWKLKSRSPNGLRFCLLKESWRSPGRPSEWSLLEMVKDIPGVVQMWKKEPGRRTISEFRC